MFLDYSANISDTLRFIYVNFSKKVSQFANGGKRHKTSTGNNFSATVFPSVLPWALGFRNFSELKILIMK